MRNLALVGVIALLAMVQSETGKAAERATSAVASTVPRMGTKYASRVADLMQLEPECSYSDVACCSDAQVVQGVSEQSALSARLLASSGGAPVLLERAVAAAESSQRPTDDAQDVGLSMKRRPFPPAVTASTSLDAIRSERALLERRHRGKRVLVVRSSIIVLVG